MKPEIELKGKLELTYDDVQDIYAAIDEVNVENLTDYEIETLERLQRNMFDLMEKYEDIIVAR